MNFSSFPVVIAEWSGEDVSLNPATRDSLQAGNYLFRTYRDSGTGAEITLFLVYFPSQRIGETIHSPKNCLPGSGWLFIQSGRRLVSLPHQIPIEVNQYLVARGTERHFVMYWYEAHGRKVANEYLMKYYLLLDSIRLGRSDGSLIRVSTEVRTQETVEHARTRILHFLDQTLPITRDYIPQ